VTSFLFVFGGSSIWLKPTPLNGFLCKNTANEVVSGREVPFGGLDDFLFKLLNFRKTAILGTDFDWTSFFLRPKTALTWGCSNIDYPKSSSSPHKSGIVNR